MRGGDAVVSRLYLFGDEQIVLGLQEVCAAVDRELEIVAVCDRVLRAGLDAVAAENTTTVVNIVDLCEALIDARSFGWRARIVFGDDVDAVRRTGGGAQETGHAFLFAALVHVQQ